MTIDSRADLSLYVRFKGSARLKKPSNQTETWVKAVIQITHMSQAGRPLKIKKPVKSDQ